MLSTKMFSTCTAALILVLLVACAAAQSDPNCSLGIKASDACCKKRCGKCGGIGCGVRSKAQNTPCCISQIRKNKKSCNLSTAPCKLTGSAVATPPTTAKCPAKGKFEGSWTNAQVNSGSLVKRHEACALMVNGLVVLIGGRGENKAVSLYDPKKKSWTSRSGPGSNIQLHHMQCVASNSKIYIVSSWNTGFPFEKNTDKIYIYDVAKDKWSTKAALPERRRRGGAAAILRKGLIYVIGGNRGGHGAHATTLGWMDAYNIAKDKWITNLPTMPDGRDHTGGALVNDQLCVAGGRDGGRADFFSAVKKSTWCYSFASKKWLRKKDFPTPRAGSSYGRTCDGRLMVAGGEGSSGAFTNVDVFDGCSWKSVAPLGRARHGSGVATSKCSTCGQLFIPSGSGSRGGSPELTTTELFSPPGRSRCTSF